MIAIFLTSQSRKRQRVDSSQYDPQTALFSQIASGAPSSRAAVGKLADNPDWNKLVLDRPTETDALPVTLLHHVFGEFVDGCETYQTIAATLSGGMGGYPAAEDDRGKILKIVSEYLELSITPTAIHNTPYATDGSLVIENNCLVISEAKNEVGSTGAEPFV